MHEGPRRSDSAPAAERTPARLVDHAAYLVTQAPHLPPFTGRAEDAILGVSCATYRRAALDRLAPDLDWPFEVVDPVWAIARTTS